MKENNKTKNKVIAIFTISFLGALLGIFITLYAVNASQNAYYGTTLEYIYQKHFYDLVDNVNNTEIRLAKIINTQDQDKDYQAKLLREISYNAFMLQENFSNLPCSVQGVEDSIAFVNQVKGYTEVLSSDLEKGKNLSKTDYKTLDKIYDSVLSMKNSLAKMSEKMYKENYNILNASLKLDKDINKFTAKLAQMKPQEVEYPTMIYDGPFSDSTVKKAVRGLKFSAVDETTAKSNLLKVFTNYNDSQIQYQGETLGRFETYNYSVKDAENIEIGFIQMTKLGGKVLTATSYTDKKTENISMDNAKQTALNFVNKNGVENAKVVWSDKIGGNAYFNIAPVVNKIIYYSDLIKIKVDLYNGDILGYEASDYYTNHTEREIVEVTVTKNTAQSKLDKKFIVQESRLALIPLEYNREVLCWEFICKLGGDDYYFYYNVQTNVLENILKVIKTNDGSLIM